ncbi:hypothetical protein CDAR_40851 [Caerostris darwini]|uniref:Uncharacterized protein n=1 Tax=Caerostris darwini TaxID=1538125 RepID=A0AAV4P9P1_9ARAC|nr:hypothetical protein CDAR_40851 [Caerostris darwini]
MCQRLSTNDEKIIVSNLWYGQEQGPYSVSICQRLSKSDKKNYCEQLMNNGSVSIYERLSNNDEKIVSHLWYAQEQEKKINGPTAFPSNNDQRPSNNDEKVIAGHSVNGTDRNRGPTAFPSVSASVCAYLTMMKKIIVSHLLYGQEHGSYSVSICERLSNNDENNYCQQLMVRTVTEALQRFYLSATI